YFLLFMRTPNEDYNDLKRFNVESSYRYKLSVTENYTDFLNSEYKDNYSNFIASRVERANGIYYKSSDTETEIIFNPLFLRHNAMKDKENYYSTYRQAFIKETSNLIGKELTGIFNVNDELKRNGSDLSNLLAEVKAEEEEKELTNAELKANFKDCFTEDVYNAIKYGDDKPTVDYFRRHTHRYQRSAAFRNVKITDYETCLIVSNKASRQADINSYFDDISTLVHVATFKHTKNMTITKGVYVKLLEIANKQLFSSDIRELPVKLSKTLKVNKRHV